MPAEPLDQRDDLLVGPHPGRPSPEGVQHLAGALAGIVQALDVAVDALAVGPVPLDRDEREALLGNQPAADLGPPGVILGRPVRCLAQEHVSGLADRVQERIQALGPVERPGHRPELGRQCRGDPGLLSGGSSHADHRRLLSRTERSPQTPLIPTDDSCHDNCRASSSRSAISTSSSSRAMTLSTSSRETATAMSTSPAPSPMVPMALIHCTGG